MAESHHAVSAPTIYRGFILVVLYCEHVAYKIVTGVNKWCGRSEITSNEPAFTNKACPSFMALAYTWAMKDAL